MESSLASKAGRSMPGPSVTRGTISGGGQLLDRSTTVPVWMTKLKNRPTYETGFLINEKSCPSMRPAQTRSQVEPEEACSSATSAEPGQVATTTISSSRSNTV